MLAPKKLGVLAIPVALALATRSVCGQTADSSRRTPLRIIGVYDSRTGSPIEGVQVRDAFSGVVVIWTK